jgi:hypothetical protein
MNKLLLNAFLLLGLATTIKPVFSTNNKDNVDTITKTIITCPTPDPLPNQDEIEQLGSDECT